MIFSQTFRVTFRVNGMYHSRLLLFSLRDYCALFCVPADVCWLCQWLIAVSRRIPCWSVLLSGFCIKSFDSNVYQTSNVPHAPYVKSIGESIWYLPNWCESMSTAAVFLMDIFQQENLDKNSTNWIIQGQQFWHFRTIETSFATDSCQKIKA